MDGMSVETLSRLAEDMLASPDKAVREAAAARLRRMSGYDNFEALKQLLPQCTGNYLRFVIGKAMQYIVSNELGPRERGDMQSYVLDYLVSVRERGERLPLFVRNELYSIYAAAFYINWRLMVVSLETGSKGIGRHVVSELTSRFPTEDVFEFLLVMIDHIAQQESRGTLSHFRSAFASDILPSFFQLGVEHIDGYGEMALRLCCAVLDSIPSSPNEPLITVRLTTYDSVFLDDASGWFPALTIAVQKCGHLLLTNPSMELSRYCAQVLRSASTVVCTDPEWFSTRNALNDVLLEFTGELLTLYISTGINDLLKLSCAVLVSVFERDEGKVSVYMYNRPHLIELWAEAARGLLKRWEQHEEELRQEVMHLFYLFGDRVIPRTMAMNGGGCQDSRTPPISAIVLQVGECYFENVVNKAHLQEDSEELRCELGVMLHNEKTLLPIAEMLFCEQIDLYSLIIQRLVSTIEQYERCVRLRESGDKECLGELMLSLAISQESLPFAFLNGGNAFLFLTHVCLSRLSVMISTVAIAMLNDTARGTDKIIEIIGQFAQGLIVTTDAITTAFLESLSLTNVEDSDACRSDMFNGEFSCGYASNTKIHVGVLRSLFFYCGCVYESQFETFGAFNEILAGLLHYVYVYHSDKVALVTDANSLLMSVLGQNIGSCLLSSYKMTSILTAVKDDTISLLRAGDNELSSGARKARSGLLTALVYFVESRHLAGYPTLDIFPCLISRTLQYEQLMLNSHNLMKDLIAVTQGIHHSDTLYWFLEGLSESQLVLAELLRANPTTTPLVVELCAKLCDLVSEQLPEDRKCETRCSLFTFAMFAIDAAAEMYGIDKGDADVRVQLSSINEVDERLVYNISNIISQLVVGEWCNLGVVLMYNRDFLFNFHRFLVFVMATPVELLMSHARERGQVFNTITCALLCRGDVGAQIRLRLNGSGGYAYLLSYLVRCLSCSFLMEILTAIDMVLSPPEGCAGGTPPAEEQIIGDIFYEVSVHIAGCPFMERRELELCFRMLRTCYDLSSLVCSTKMNALLDFCSAYHRVRLRHIYTLLRSEREDMFRSYVHVFGLSSKLQTLSAW
uniref:Uncharacterized protein TCIL3000_10_11800 n=1 Tax=Trypanosoma congolense (strain IL3000) TaxID=1068625 RepID=G0UYD2_TRYCI|nr:unnamed protein product [Trypanosoma congolense IL3000]